MAKLPFDPDKFDDKDKMIYDEMVARRKKLGAPFGGPYPALINHAELCQKVEALGAYLKFYGKLPRDVYQFVVLSVSQETKSAFEWADHVEHALAAGVPESVLSILKAKGIKDPDFQSPYQLAAQVLSATFYWKSIPNEVQQAAISSYGIHGFIEIVVLSGFYQMIAAVNQGFDVSIP